MVSRSRPSRGTIPVIGKPRKNGKRNCQWMNVAKNTIAENNFNPSK